MPAEQRSAGNEAGMVFADRRKKSLLNAIARETPKLEIPVGESIEPEEFPNNDVERSRLRR